MAEKVPRPSNDFKLDTNKLEEWINEHSDKVFNDVTRFLSENISHYSQAEFEIALNESVEDFNNQVKEPFLVFQPRVLGKRSEWWTYELAKEFGISKASGEIILGGADFKKYDNGHYEKISEYYGNVFNGIINTGIRNILFIDDAVYSGGRINNFINSIFEERIFKNISLYILAPYMTDLGAERLSKIDCDRDNYYKSRFDKVTILKHRQITRLKNIEKMDCAPEGISWAINRYMGKDYNYLTLTFFDHKIPDRASMLDWVSEGNVFNNAPSNLKINFMPDIRPPYEKIK